MDNEQVAAGQIDEQPETADTVSSEPSGSVQAPELASSPEGAEVAGAQPTAGEPAAEAHEEAKASAKAGHAPLEELKPGMTMHGKVKNIVDFGAFIDIGVGRDGLAHVSTLKRAGIDQTLKVGDEIEVVVRRVDTDTNRISLTVPRAEREVKASLSQVEVGAVVTGKVMRLVDFGAFVDIGAPTDGLLHVSQLQGGFVRHPSEVLSVGDELQVRILDVDVERRRISLTMRDLAGEAPAPVQAPAAAQPEPARGRFDSPNPERQRTGRGAGRSSERRSGGRSRGRSSDLDYQPEPEGSFPTAVELAFQQAVADKKRKKQRRDLP